VGNKRINIIKLEKHRILSDTEFEEQFRLCRIDPSLFTHEAHLRLAWIHINNYGVTTAKKNIEHQIRKFVKHVGAEDKYHQTITIASIEAVYHFMKRSTAKDFETFIEQNSELKTDFKNLISSHYSQNIFNSQKARIEYVEPNIQPFI